MKPTLALFVPIGLLLAGCVNKADSQAADARDRALFRAGRRQEYGLIYDNGAPDLKAATSRDIFIGYMTRIDRRLSVCQPAKPRMDWHINVTSAGAFRTQGYSRACANGALQEEVTIVIRNGVAKLAGYSANSQLLLTDQAVAEAAAVPILAAERLGSDADGPDRPDRSGQGARLRSGRLPPLHGHSVRCAAGRTLALASATAGASLGRRP